MARWNVLRFLGLLFLLNNWVNYSSCVYDEHYAKYGLEKFCYISDKTSIVDLKGGAAIVTTRRMFERWTVLNNVHCKFTFKAAKGDRLFGVIQKISFRKNGTECIDYVQFERKDGHKTEKFCGSLDRSKIKYYPVPEPEGDTYSSESRPLVRTYAEHDPAELKTEIFISKEKLHDGEYLALSIVYTSFTNCINADSSIYSPIIVNHTCMMNKFLCDGFYNCAPGACSDEDDCPNNTNEIISTGTGTKVTVGAVTTLILCFVIFVMCLWICKRSQKLCWSSQNMFSLPGQLVTHTGGSVIPSVPSAPMLEVAVSLSVADKDLPPSYDSLFPEQSNPVRS